MPTVETNRQLVDGTLSVGTLEESRMEAIQNLEHALWDNHAFLGAKLTNSISLKRTSELVEGIIIEIVQQNGQILPPPDSLTQYLQRWTEQERTMVPEQQVQILGTEGPKNLLRLLKEEPYSANSLPQLVETHTYLNAYIEVYQKTLEPEIQNVLEMAKAVAFERSPKYSGAALAILDRILLFDPNHPEACALRDRIEAKRTQFIKMRIGRVLKKAQRLNGQHAPADELFRLYSQTAIYVRRLDPKDPTVQQFQNEVETGLMHHRAQARSLAYASFGLVPSEEKSATEEK